MSHIILSTLFELLETNLQNHCTAGENTCVQLNITS